MTSPITIFRGSSGLNTKIDPARLSSNKGIKDLAVAGDVDVTDTGRISRRKGYTKRLSDISSHSLFSDKGDCLFVTGTSLCLLNPDYSYDAVATVHEGARASYAQVNNQIYWCNGYEKGYIEDKANNEWIKGSYVGPDTKRAFVNPPIGSLVEYYRTRMYVAQANALWFSESMAFGAFDLVRGFIPYNSPIRMVRAVEDGIYVSTSNNQYFLKGNSPKEFEQIKIANYPAIQWSDTKLNGALISYPNGGYSVIEGEGHGAIWMSNEGVCYGGPGGFKNLTLDKIASFPVGLTGSGLIYNGRYIGLINP